MLENYFLSNAKQDLKKTTAQDASDGLKDFNPTLIIPTCWEDYKSSVTLFGYRE